MSNSHNIDSNENNTVISLELTYQQFNSLITLYESGELTKILGTPVLSIEAISQHNNYTDIEPVQETTTSASRQPVVNLNQCLQQDFATAIASGWKRIQGILEPQLAMGYRSRSDSREDQIILNNLTQQLTQCFDEDTRLQIAQSIVEINPGNQAAIAALTELARTTQDEEIRWRAIDNLARIAPNDLPKGVGIIRELRLASNSLKLSISALQINDDDVSVFIKIYPSGSPTTLPKNIKLIMLDEAGEVFDQIPSDSEEYQVIQYKVIYKVGEKFGVRIALDSDSITESFVA